MYEESEQKVLKMTLDEFKSYKAPEGWKLMYVNGSSETVRGPGSLGSYSYIAMRVTIQKENDNGI